MIRNQKKVIQIALPAVIIIWGFVIFELFYYKNKKSAPTQNMVVEKYRSPAIQKKETFELLPTESDPFLGTVYIKKTEPKVRSISKIKKKPIKWPKISYNGLVSDNNSNAKIFVVDINGVQYLMEVGEKIQDITVIKASEATISLKYKNELKEFPLQ